MNDSLQTLVAEFLKDQICLIVEPSQTFSAGIQACLHSFGLKSEQVVMAKKFEDAKRLIEELKPKMLVTEYEVTGGLGLALIEAQEKFFDETSRISIIVTKNSSDSAVAEAAEEQVDAFILKPFSTESFKNKVTDVFRRKVNPSDYMKRIRAAKQQLEAKAYEDAVSGFMGAKPLDPRPTLACYYSGNSMKELGRLDEALAEFREGRKYQPLHYKCLIGEFETLMAQKKYVQAYTLVPSIRNNYPITSLRLGQIFIAAVYTRQFSDLPGYYELFTRLDHRTPWLIQLISLALLTAGKFCIAAKDLGKALQFFDMGITAAARDLAFIEMVTDELLLVGARQEAQAFFSKAMPSDIGTPLHTRVSFKIDRYILAPEQAIEAGRKLVMAGHGTPDVYIPLVEMTAKAGKVALAESIIGKAVETHPALRSQLYKILEKTPKQKV